MKAIHAYFLVKILALVALVAGMLCLFEVSPYAGAGVLLVAVFHIFDQAGEDLFKLHLEENRRLAAGGLPK